MEIPPNETLVKAAGTVALAYVLTKHFLSRPAANQQKRYEMGQKATHPIDPSKQELDAIFTKLSDNFARNVTSQISDKGRWDYNFRIQQLYGIRDMLVENADEFWKAAKEDVGRTKGEMVLQTGAARSEIDSLIKGLKEWMAPESRGTPIWMQPSTSCIIREPLGVVLVLGTWNYSALMALLPTAGAICAGNAVVLKPSEVAPAQSALIAKLLPRYVDPAVVQVVEGGPKTSQNLVDSYEWGKVFYVGGNKIAAMIAKSCAERHIPFCLELGGKSPTIILEDADLLVSCRRIVQGKFVNAGQTCIAPDFIIAVGNEKRQKEVAEALAKEIRVQYPGDVSKFPEYARIVNSRHFDRVLALLKNAGRVLVGGAHDASQKFIEPTLLTDVSPDAPIMQEEIFGPLLPIINVSNVNDAIEFVRAKPKPLCLYVFGNNQKQVNHILSRTTSGSACVNEAVFQYLNSHLPFGGVGPSGVGAVHGEYSFKEFSHSKSVMIRSLFLDLYFRYLPYLQENWVQQLFAWLLTL